MRILITSAASPMARAVAAELKDDHQLRLLDDDPALETGEEEVGEVVRGSLLDADAVWQAVRGMDAVVHTAEPPAAPKTGNQDSMAKQQFMLDWATRGTHILFQAAVETGVRRFVYGSTLEIFSSYPEDVYISELWKPRPGPEMPAMSRYLGELVCREFARDFPVTATALRLGRIVIEEEVEGQRPDAMWLDRRDAAQAFHLALNRDRGDDLRFTARWALYHICADIHNPRFLIDSARTIGYRPEHNFHKQWKA
jgi:nucleoside-diphosphate-sugar epimerase